MMEICRENREEIEREFMALILHKNEVLGITQILPKYLKDKRLSKLMQYCIECYKENKVVNHFKILEKHKDFDIGLFFEIYTNVMWFNNCWKEQLELAEESIVKYYKEDLLIKLNEDLQDKKIKFDDFAKKVEKLNKITLKDKNKKEILNIEDVEYNENEELEYIKSNVESLDKKIIGFALGQLSVWSGGNASAKSTYLNQIAIESINQGYNTIIYSGELVAKRLLKWIVMQCAGKRNMNYNEEKNYFFVNSNTKDKITKWLNGKLFIYNNENGNKVGQIISSIKQSVKQNNAKVIILDNLMSMNLNDYGDNKYDTQSMFIQDLSALAKELNVHIHFVCHPRKVTNFLRKIDISGSADLTNIADNVFIMHRVNNDFRIKTKEMFKWNDNHEMYSYTNIIEVCKNRDFGVEDYFVGLYFEVESKRLLSYQTEEKNYGWEKC